MAWDDNAQRKAGGVRTSQTHDSFFPAPLSHLESTSKRRRRDTYPCPTLQCGVKDGSYLNPRGRI